jgi:uncharacterized membrane protein
VLSAAVLVGGELLLLLAVTPATWLIDDETLRRAVTRVVARRFARMTVAALVVLTASGIYLFVQFVPQPIRENMNDFRWGSVFAIKMLLFFLMLVLIGVHGMVFGPRIARASELAIAGDEDAAWRLENIRRTSLLLSLALLVVTVAVLASGVVLGNHDYSYLPRG